MKTLGTTIAALRRDKGMTQLELAEKMGVTDKAVSKWERNLSCPDVSSLPKLAEALGISVDELMQVKTGSKPEMNASHILTLVLRAVPLAMAVAVFVLGVLNQLDGASGCSMLAIGLFCVALNQFRTARE